MTRGDNDPQCDGETFLGFTVKQCDQPATVHAYQTRHEQYDFCARHYYFWLHGHYPEDETEATQDDHTSDAV